MNKDLMIAVITTQTAKLAEQIAKLTPEPGPTGPAPFTLEEQGIREAWLAISCGGAKSDYARTIKSQFASAGKTLNPAVFKDDDDEDEYDGESPMIDVVPLAAFVPLKALNGHNYAIGKPAVFFEEDNDHAIDIDADEGNHMDLRVMSLRPATVDEIKKFLEETSMTVFAKAGLKARTLDLIFEPNTPENLAAVLAAL